jgi:hypothetical protein
MPGIRAPIDPDRRLSEEHARQVHERVAAMGYYLSRLSWRLRENGFEPGVRLCDLADSASQAVGALGRYLGDPYAEPSHDWQISDLTHDGPTP